MLRQLVSLQEFLVYRVSRVIFEWPWYLVTFVFRLLYSFRVEGAENVPPEGPFILVLNEHSPISTIISGWLSVVLLNEALDREPDSTLSYVQEEAFGVPFLRSALAYGERFRGHSIAALTPHSAGRLGLRLVDGYRVLQNDGIVVTNPEGDMSWDGRPLPLGSAVAWLGLQTAAPLVPAICSVGAYDIWPRWQVWPSLRGEVALQIGQPFRVCETPQHEVTDEDLAQANTRIRTEINRLRYGPGGISEWAGPLMRDGTPLAQPLELPHVSQSADSDRVVDDTQVPVWKRGISQLLWRCPVCHTEDALVHQRTWFRPQSLGCQACGTRWAIRRVEGRDFRLKVVEGPPSLVGVDMALSTWYDEMKRSFTPSPIEVDDVDLLPDEEVYLAVNGVSLLPYQPNALFDDWTGREPPRTQLPGRRQFADWGSIGEGQLLLTSQRLLWQEPQRELDFWWPSVTAVYLWLANTLGIRYGAARYRFALDHEVGLKWLTYAGTLARQATEEGHEVTISSF